MTEEEKVQHKIKAITDEIQRCGCECHRPGVTIMHFMECCGATYVKLNEVENVARRAV